MVDVLARFFVGSSIVVFLLCLKSGFGYDIRGKTALVTGASGGIGAGIAKRLAQEGAKVWIHYHTRREGALATQESIQKQGGTSLGIISCDFREPQNIHTMMAQLGTDDGGIDILVNNAGAIHKVAVDDDDDQMSLWHETLAINLHAPLLLSRLVRPAMTTNGGGVIIMVSSIHGLRSNEYMGAYAASKAALDSVTRTLALEWASDKIRVNGIAPGVVPVERTATAFATPGVSEAWLRHIPVDKLGTPENVAEAVIPLITNEWITGTTWNVDGGMMARTNMPPRPRPPKPQPKEEKDPTRYTEVRLERNE